MMLSRGGLSFLVRTCLPKVHCSEDAAGVRRPVSVTSVQNGESMVDAEFLAAKLGLSTDSLKA
ncbi:MAG: hypothetical protein JWL84_3627 [Rhodospirillales bacterium]|jgi:hypothetical protein|nr:hypothetical protein [Rhodospirillales bacterium]